MNLKTMLIFRFVEQTVPFRVVEKGTKLQFYVRKVNPKMVLTAIGLNVDNPVN